MKIIYEQTSIVKQILGNQKVDYHNKYRKIFYLTECSVDDGVLFLNTLTYELLYLTEQDIHLLESMNLNNPMIRYLVEHYFFVPEGFDDKKFATQVISTRFQIQNIYTNVPFSFFVILPTTGCNARCFYCIEKGAKVSNMTEQTAHDVADFIKRKGDKKVRIQWFGGEPTINIKAIDIISRDLQENGVNFTSKMVTNGYLLDENIIKKAIELWKLDTLQITLDGTEKVYNKVKDYVYNDVNSPFEKVLNNIDNALKAGIQVNIRLNMDEHNAEDLFELSYLLVEKFNKFKNCYIYVVRLFEDSCDKIKYREAIDRHKIIESSIKLQNFIDANMPKLLVKNLPISYENPNSCMACMDNSVMIVPDGHLGKCEHFVDSDFFGSIYSDDYDLKKIAKYKERTSIVPECVDCKFLPLCIRLKCCNGGSYHCDEFDKKAYAERHNARLRNVYNIFLETEKQKNQLGK